MSDIDEIEGFEPEAEATEEPPDFGPWNQWQQAGIDPAGYNPYDARKAINLNNALSDPGHRSYALEQILKGHELPEGMSWDEARAAIQEAAQQRQQDPWESVLQPQYEPEGELLGYGPDGQPVYAAPPVPQQPGIDPTAIKSAVEEQIRRERQAWEAERQRQDDERRQGEEFERAIADVRMKDNLTEADTRWLIPATIANLQGSMQGASMSEAAKNTWAEMKAWRNASAAQMAADQQNVPRTRTPSGPTPSPNQPPANLREAGQRAGDFFNG